MLLRIFAVSIPAWVGFNLNCCSGCIPPWTIPWLSRSPSFPLRHHKPTSSHFQPKYIEERTVDSYFFTRFKVFLMDFSLFSIIFHPFFHPLGFLPPPRWSLTAPPPGRGGLQSSGLRLLRQGEGLAAKAPGELRGGGRCSGVAGSEGGWGHMVIQCGAL
jgi:hypothetical protein